LGCGLRVTSCEWNGLGRALKQGYGNHGIHGFLRDTNTGWGDAIAPPDRNASQTLLIMSQSY